jgi:transformation/transcription domain-associated protein
VSESLHLYTSTIMEVCMKNATEIENPQGYMQLLCTMFRALSGVKFEVVVQELYPYSATLS